MLREAMSVEEMLNEAETFGLGFHTWRMMRNEEKHWDEDSYDETVWPRVEEGEGEWMGD